MNSIIEELEERIEHWRQRAEIAEEALHGRLWEEAVRPLSLYQTRILRLLAKRDMMANVLFARMELDYPNTTHNALKSQICLLRAKLPESMVPPLKYRGSVPYTIPDRQALQAFLETGVVPEAARFAGHMEEAA